MAASSSSTLPTSSSSISTLATQLQSKNVFSLVSFKLDGPTYLLWRAQFLPTLRGLRLLGYVDGSFPCPPEQVVASSQTDATSTATSASSSSIILNPEYTAWQEQDQLILGWLLSSLIESVLAQVISCDTSHSAWLTLQTLFASSSRMRIHDLKHDLSNITKGSLSMTDYIKKVKSLVDSLAVVGHTISSQDQIDHTLNGLGPTYDSFVLSIYTKLDDLLVAYVHSLLLSYNRRLERHAHPNEAITSLSANVASKYTTTGSNFHQFSHSN